MERNEWFFRAFFLCIGCLFAIAYQCTAPNQDLLTVILRGAGFGTGIWAVLVVLELLLKRYSLRTFNTALVGLLIGSAVGSVLALSLKLVLNALEPASDIQNSVLLINFAASIYLGIMLTFSSAERWWLSIPFVRLAPASQVHKKEILVDISALEDCRLIELARTGILDHQLVVPTFIVNEIQKAIESSDELIRNRGRKCHETLKRLESMPALGLQIKEFHFPEQEELSQMLHKACRLIQAYILTSQEPSALRPEEETALHINIESIAAALKPGAQRGEVLQIKIQRLGKEPKQGVGYLEDGTMVVVNGGGEFLGQTIRTQVLSQKYSSSGKIIFCNAIASEERRVPTADGHTYQQMSVCLQP